MRSVCLRRRARGSRRGRSFTGGRPVAERRAVSFGAGRPGPAINCVPRSLAAGPQDGRADLGPLGLAGVWADVTIQGRARSSNTFRGASGWCQVFGQGRAPRGRPPPSVTRGSRRGRGRGWLGTARTPGGLRPVRRRGSVGRIGFLGLSRAELFERRSQHAARQSVESGLAWLSVSDREEQRVEGRRAAGGHGRAECSLDRVDRIAEPRGRFRDAEVGPPRSTGPGVGEHGLSTRRRVGERFCYRLGPAGEDREIFDFDHTRSRAPGAGIR